MTPLLLDVPRGARSETGGDVAAPGRKAPGEWLATHHKPGYLSMAGLMVIFSVRGTTGGSRRGSPTVLCALGAFLLTACTGIHEVRYPLHPAPNECQVTEVRVTSLSTLTSGVCWDQAGNPVGMVGGAGKPTISVPLEVLATAATIAGPVGGALILGRYIHKSSQDIRGTGAVDLDVHLGR